MIKRIAQVATISLLGRDEDLDVLKKSFLNMRKKLTREKSDGVQKERMY